MNKKKEIEIKFSCPQNVLKDISKLDIPAIGYNWGKCESLLIQDTYLDTQDYTILKADAGLRCRNKAGKLKVTLKSSPLENEGVVEREELEQEVSQKEFDTLMTEGKPPLFVKSALQKLIREKSIKPVLNLENQREINEILKFDGSPVAELSMDYVTFSSSGMEVPFYGLEIELKDEGSNQDLKKITASLKNIFLSLEVDPESKYKKGIRLLSR